VSFDVAADAYDRFMGRYSRPLAVELAARLDLPAGSRVLDVGCGPGALTEVLVARLGAANVVAADPSPPFVDAVQERLGVTAVTATAEQLPFGDDEYDVTVAQLVVHFMSDPVGGLREMARVTKPGGTVAASVWDFQEGGSPLATFWRAVHDLDPAGPQEHRLPGTGRGELHALAEAAGLVEIVDIDVAVEVRHPSFDDWWQPYTLGVGPSGGYVASLTDEKVAALREHCRSLLPDGEFVIAAHAWAIRGLAG